MAEFSTMCISSPIGTMVARDKGDFSNRVKCAGEQAMNNLKFNTANLALIGGSGYGAYRILKSPNATSKVVKVFDKGVSVIAKKAPNIAQKLSNMPSKFKVLGLIAAPVLLGVGYLCQRWAYNAGQIDQKYTDKAKIEEATNKNILA